MEILTVPRVLRQKWDDDVIDAVVELLNKSNLKLKEDVLVFVEDKFERRLTEEMSKVNQKITEEISSVNQKISESHANLIKWMFLFWIGQIGVILGILFAFFKT
jgi:hypothetical protein